jgi:hypothetical protein
MDPIMWDCQAAYSAGSLSTFQRRVLSDLYGGRKHTIEMGVRIVAGDHRPYQTAERRARHAAANRPVRDWPGLAMVSLLTLVPMAMSLYMAFGPM